MKTWTSDYTFDHPWEKVAQASWRKYPNPMNTAVIGTDVVERKVIEGILYTQRLVSTQWFFPEWARPVEGLVRNKVNLKIGDKILELIASTGTEKPIEAELQAPQRAKWLNCGSFVGSTSVFYASEISHVDPVNKEMVLKTKNLTLSKYINVDEIVRYIPHPTDPGKTILKQAAVIKVQGPPFSSYIENMLTKIISSNAGKGRQAIEWVIPKIEAEAQELKNSAVKSTDEFINQAKKSIDDLTNSAKKSMDELSSAAKNSFLDSFTSSPSSKLPKF